MTGKRFSVFKSEITGLFVVNDNTHEFNFEGVEDAGTIMKLVGLLNNYIEEVEQLKMGINSLKLLVQNWEALDEEKDEQLNKQNQALKKIKKENEQLQHKLSQQEMEYATTCNRLTEENEQLQRENEKLESLWEDKCIKEYMGVVGEYALQEIHKEKYGDK